MTVASLLHNKAGSPLFDTLYSVIALACLLALFAVSRGGYGPGAALLLAIFLYCVCSGATLFGLLNTLSAQRLGKISYSLYLTHGLVLTVVFAMEPIRTFAMNSVAAYWAIGIVCGALLLGVASLSYILVEAPGIELGKRLVRWRVRRRIAVQLPQSVTSGGDVTRISTSAEPPTAR
jgi:peptidoglycan/LPS O-acetylase OafA/YrhL